MSKFYAFLLLLSLYRMSLAHYFTVSMNDYILLHQNYSGITTMSKDFEGNFLVGFLDGTARKYASDFSSYVSIIVPSVVNLFDTRYIFLTVTLSNGTNINLNSRITVITFSNFTTIRDYGYYNYVLEQTFNFNETIISQLGFPLTVSSISHTYHVLICNNSVAIAYRGSIMYFSYGVIFGSTTVMTCTAAIYGTFSLTTSIDTIYANHPFYVSLGSNTYRLKIKLTFVFDPTSNHFNLLSSLTSFTKALIFTSPSSITYVSIANGLLLMQSNSSGLSYIYDIGSFVAGTTSGILTDQIFCFFYIHGGYYVLQSSGILELIYDPSSVNLYLSYSVVTLPINMYYVILANPINPFYIPGMPFLYKAGLCPGQEYLRLSDQTCISFTCLDTNCSWCPISSTICTICNPGFIMDFNYTCQPNVTIPSIIINTTVPNTTTPNTTVPNTTTPNTTVPNTTVPNIPTTPSNTTQTVQIYYKSFFEWLLEYLLNILKLLISIPTARRVISPTFYFFGVFDDIYLFQFHDRTYGKTMSNVFDNLNEIEQKKWSLINYENILNLFRVDEKQFKITTNYQDNYNAYHFTNAGHQEMNTEGLWANCQNFFIVALPITILVFILGKVIFKILFKSIISKIFRRFDFWSLLIVLLLDGNIQQFSFYLATDWKNMFFFNISSKLIKFQTILFGFLIIIVSCGVYFLSYSFYLKPNRHIMDNNKNSIMGQACLILQFGLRNCYLGLMNSFLRGFEYKYMLSILLVSQIGMASFFAVSLSMKIYQSNLKMWIYILLNFNKILLIITLFVDYMNINLPVIELVQQNLIIIQIIVFLFGSILETYLTLKDVKNFIRSFIRQQEKKPKYLQKALSKKGITIFVENIEQRHEQKLKNTNKNKPTFNPFKIRKQITFKHTLKLKNTKTLDKY